jgi:glycosyltransferase involved in cell wall biosynthesis
MENTAIVFLSNAAWSYGLPTNRQQLPIRLADHAQVLYASPFSLSQAILGHLHLGDFQPNLRQIKPNLHSFDYPRLLPMVRGQVWPFILIDRWLQIRLLRKYIGQLGFNKFILWFYFPPNFAYLQSNLNPVLTCYHCTDDHAGYAESLGLPSRKIRKTEKQLVSTVDVVFTTSRPLYQQKSIINCHTYLMPNVADVEHFYPVAEGTVSIASDLQDIQHPVVGFIGAVDRYKVNFELVNNVARKLPKWNFVFVGPIGSGDGTSIADLPQRSNLYFLEARPYASLPRYLAGFDVCIIPYNLNSYTSGVFPLKFWEYLASGKPIVTTPLPALQEHYEHVEVGSDTESFVLALRHALATSEDEALKQHRVELAAHQSWERRAEEMLEVLNSHL